MTDLEHLVSWHDTPTRSAVVDFVARVTTPGEEFVAVEDRIAVFDNDGTLWCEKPMPVQLGFIVARLAEMAEKDQALRTRQPWQSAYEKDYGWLGHVIEQHYAGDDTQVKVLMAGILAGFAGMTVEEYESAATAFLADAPHPTLGRRLRDCGYQPMVELLRYLEVNGFTTYIASGGDRDFMRPVVQEIYAIPPERVIGSSNALSFQDDGDKPQLVFLAEPDMFDDGPVKPVRIWSRIGRRPLIAVGNSNGDIPMLRFAGRPGGPALRLLVRHDDADREFATNSGAEKALDTAVAESWTVISIRDDWKTVFAAE